MTLDIERALQFPMEDEDWLKTVGIGGLLVLFAFFIVPALAAYGYVLRAIRAGIDDEEPPVFEAWGDLIVDGVKLVVIGLVYQILPLIVFVVLVGGGLMSLVGGGSAGGSAGGALAGLGVAGILGGFVLSALLSLVFGYVGGAGVINFARTGKIGDAFDLSVIRQLVFSGEYLLAWGVILGLGIALNLVLGIVNLFTFGIGGLLAVWPTFYLLVVSGFIWGRSYDEAIAPDSVDSTP